MAITLTFLHDTLFSFRTKFINWKLTPFFTKSLSKICEFLAKLPKAAAAFDLVFSSESFIKLVRIGMVGLNVSYKESSWKLAFPRTTQANFLTVLSWS